MSKSLAYSVVDAFTSTSFKGNPAAVVILDPRLPLPDRTLQLIAAEFNLSETAFLTPIDAAVGRFALRWFTPEMEFPLCGHATLASASVLFSSRTYLPETIHLITFETLSGLLTARLNVDGRIELEFPAGEAIPAENALEEIVRDVVQQSFEPEDNPSVLFVGVGNGVSFGKYMLIHVDGIDLAKATINTTPLKVLAPQYETIIITQRGRDASETFASRVFCPVESILEDPVTGSAHCMLGPYWATQLRIQGTVEMIGRQVSARSGVVGVVWNSERGTCNLRGYATLFARGELLLPS